MNRTVTCIGCPLGCAVTVKFDESGKIKAVFGNTCPKGESYARKEVAEPTRVVTSIVPVQNGDIAMVSVKTASDIPKNKIEDCMGELKKIRVAAPLKIGDIVIKDICGTGVSVVVTKDINAV